MARTCRIESRPSCEGKHLLLALVKGKAGLLSLRFEVNLF